LTVDQSRGPGHNRHFTRPSFTGGSHHQNPATGKFAVWGGTYSLYFIPFPLFKIECFIPLFTIRKPNLVARTSIPKPGKPGFARHCRYSAVSLTVDHTDKLFLKTNILFYHKCLSFNFNIFKLKHYLDRRGSVTGIFGSVPTGLM
jgi:hypothetical protein